MTGSASPPSSGCRSRALSVPCARSPRCMLRDACDKVQGKSALINAHATPLSALASLSSSDKGKPRPEKPRATPFLGQGLANESPWAGSVPACVCRVCWNSVSGCS